MDFERIRKHDGFVYWWDLTDYLKPNKYGDLSYKLYQQGDCKLFRYKYLGSSNYKQPMGGGHGADYNEPDKDWTYTTPNTSGEVTLKSVCSR